MNLLAFVSVVSAALPGAQNPQLEPDAKPRVTVELASETVQLAGGEEFELGAHFKIPADWHLGWDNPGALGSRTRVRVTAPAGFEVSGPLYPTPRAFELEDGRVVLGYEGEVVIFFRARPPSDLPQSRRVTFTLTAEWGALDGEWNEVVGHARVELVLPSYPARDPRPSANPAVFARSRAALPKPWRQLENAKLEWAVKYADMGEGLGLALTLDVTGAESLEYFAHLIDGLEQAGSEFTFTEHGARLVVSYQYIAPNKAPPPDVHGVVRVVRNGVEQNFDVRASRPAAMVR